MNRRANIHFLTMTLVSLIAFSASGAQVYFSEAGRGFIYRANPDGTGVIPVVDTGFTSWTMPIEVDPIGQRVYWAEVGDTGSRIRSSTYSGGNIETLVDSTNTGRILDLELDLINQRLYWTDATLNRIERIHLNGLDRENVSAPVIIPEVTGIALDVPNNSIFYTSDASDGIVGRFDFDTLSITGFIDGPSPGISFGGIWDIELDSDSGVLYFVDEDDSELYSINTDGTEFTERFEPSGGSTPLGLELHDGTMYIAFGNSGNVISLHYPINDNSFGVVGTGHTRPGGVAIDPLAIPEPGVSGMLVIGLSLLTSLRSRSREKVRP